MLDLSVIPDVRGSERQLFKRCPWAWRQAYRMGLRPKRTRDALWFGELVHVAFAAWYSGPGLKRGPLPSETFERLATDELRYFKTKDASEEEVAHYTDLRDLGSIMLEGYVQRYGTDDKWHVLSAEQTFTFNVPFPDTWSNETREFLARYVGTYDLVYRDLETGFIWLGEHKTAKSIRVDHLPLDDQAGPYFTTARQALLSRGIIGPKEHFKGIMYNFLRKGIPDARPVDAQGYVVNKPLKSHYLEALGKRVDLTGKESLERLERIALDLQIKVIGERSKIQPAVLFRRYPVVRTRSEQRAQLKRMQDDLTVMEMARREEIPITKTTHWSCAKLCDFYEICRLHEAGGNWKDLRRVSFTSADPYAAHRKSTDEMGTFEL